MNKLKSIVKIIGQQTNRKLNKIKASYPFLMTKKEKQEMEDNKDMQDFLFGKCEKNEGFLF